MCRLQNNSVTWHCLNCEGVCVFAPVYKDTLQKGTAAATAAAAIAAAAITVAVGTTPSIVVAATATGPAVVAKVASSATAVSSAATTATTTAIPANGNRYTGSDGAGSGGGGVQVTAEHGTTTHIGHGADSVSNCSKLRRFSMDAKPDVNGRKCQLCVFNAVQMCRGEPVVCQHQQGHHLKFIQLPWLKNPSGTVADCYSHQKSFNVYTRYQDSVDLLSANRKMNKSMSCIEDVLGLRQYGDGGGSLFGEEILLPNTRNGQDGSGQQQQQHQYRRDSMTPAAHADATVAQKFTNFAAMAASRKQPPVRRDTCDICNNIKCTCMNRTACGMINSSRFTITTLSRNDQMIGRNSSQRSKTPTLPRNGGVFVAVRDWSPATNATPSTTSTLQSNYYEVLKNPNNNWPTYENSMVINQMRKDSEADVGGVMVGQPSPQTPIYAVVNKVNKTKNKQAYQALIEPTKYTYVGMGPSLKTASATPTATAQATPTGKDTTAMTADPSLYASIRKTNANNLTNSFATFASNNNIVGTNLDEMRGGGGSDNANVTPTALTPIDCNNSSHISITSSVGTAGAETSEIYAKVWKGPRKSLDSQKMYVRNFFCLQCNCTTWCESTF